MKNQLHYWRRTKCKYLVLIFVSLFLLRCGEDIHELSNDSPNSNQTQNEINNGSTCLQNSNSAVPGCATQIATGGGHTCALISGGVKCWGDNSYGQLGIGSLSSIPTTTPTPIPNLNNVTAIAAGRSTTCAITNGEVKCWGDNWFGQLGNQTTGGYSATPVKVKNISSATAISVGGMHACALDGGQMKCWGSNQNGQLGNQTQNDSNIPVNVMGVSNVSKISVGPTKTCVIESFGNTAKCWGGNAWGELGDGGPVNNFSLIPVTVQNLGPAKMIDAGGESHACAITLGGDVKCWGANFAGQLGTGTAIQYSNVAKLVINVSGAVSINVGERHSCAIKSTGQAKCWGNNNLGQLGDGTTSIMPVATPTLVSILTSTSALDAGGNHTCAIQGGEVYCWGNNATAQIGNGFMVGTVLTPDQITVCCWQPVSLIDAPSPRLKHTAIWTGPPLNQMIVWGGQDLNGNVLHDGGRYNLATDTWTPINMIGAPTARAMHSAVWTGTEMIVWGGYGNFGSISTITGGGRYNPATDTWLPVTSSSAPTSRTSHTAIWSGPPLNQMIIWGGQTGVGPVASGKAYDPILNLWSTLSLNSNAPSARAGHSDIWTGKKMIVWGGWNGSFLNDGRIYDSNMPAWNSVNISSLGAPGVRANHSAVWAGSPYNTMIVWGGENNGTYLGTGKKYYVPGNSWSQVSTTGAPSPRILHSAVWADNIRRMIIWGGQGDNEKIFGDGAMYEPTDNFWEPLCKIGKAPVARIYHSTVWTGTKMIVWGGLSGTLGILNDGGIYKP